MPELAERSLSPTSVVVLSEKELKQPKPDILDDEFHVDPNLDILRPLPITDSDFSVRENETLQKGLEEEFEYLSRTRQLEIDSERVKTLQDIMDKMTGPEIKTRLVIMNKGEKVEGAVFPDGTVVISQSLFNYLDTIEELTGVLGHEIGHLINKTHRRVSQVPEGSIKQFGVKWVHEAAADLQAPPDCLRKSD